MHTEILKIDVDISLCAWPALVNFISVLSTRVQINTFLICDTDGSGASCGCCKSFMIPRKSTGKNCCKMIRSNQVNDCFSCT